MARNCKRKVEIPGASSKLGKPKTTAAAAAAAAAAELYPNHPRPTPEECRSVRDHLLSLHGFPQEFARYRKKKVIHDSPDPSQPLFGEDGSDETITRKESVLDGLVRTLLSQNTTDSNSTKAFASLKSLFPTWEDVRGQTPLHPVLSTKRRRSTDWMAEVSVGGHLQSIIHCGAHQINVLDQ